MGLEDGAVPGGGMRGALAGIISGRGEKNGKITGELQRSHVQNRDRHREARDGTEMAGTQDTEVRRRSQEVTQLGVHR